MPPYLPEEPSSECYSSWELLYLSLTSPLTKSSSWGETENNFNFFANACPQIFCIECSCSFSLGMGPLMGFHLNITVILRLHLVPLASYMVQRSSCPKLRGLVAWGLRVVMGYAFLHSSRCVFSKVRSKERGWRGQNALEEPALGSDDVPLALLCFDLFLSPAMGLW